MSGKVLSRLSLTVVMIIILLGILPFSSYRVSGASGFSLVSVSWGSPRNPQKVYPGSSNVVLVVEMINNYPFTIDSLVGNLSLPAGFTDGFGHEYAVSIAIVESNSSVRNYIRPGESFRLNYVLEINESISPGTYYAVLSINYTYYNSSSGTVITSTYHYGNIPLTVSDFPSFSFSIERIVWMVDGVELNATPGSRGLSLHVFLRNLGDEDASDLIGILDLSSPFHPFEATGFYGSVASGMVFELVFNGIDIDYSASPGIYYQQLILNFSFIGYGDAIKYYSIPLNISLSLDDNEYAGLKIVRVYWDGYAKVYPGSRGVVLRTTLENMGRYTLSDLRIIAYLPSGFSNEFGRDTLNTSVSGVYGYGDFIDVLLGPLYISSSISPGIYYADVVIRGVASIEGASIIVEQDIRLPMIISEYKSKFNIVDVEWEYNNQPAFALPGSKDITLVVRVAYRGEEDISGISPTLLLPSGFTVKETLQYPQTVVPSSVFTLSFIVDISKSLESKYYSASLNIEYVVSANDLNIVKSTNLHFPIKLSQLDSFDSDVNIIEVHWGSARPQQVYSMTEDNPLSITVVNYGPYDIQGIIASLELPQGFSSDVKNVSLANILPVGSFSETVFYISVGDIEPGYYGFNISISYIISLYGTEIRKSVNYSNILKIVDPPFSIPYLKILGYQWENSYKVYPGTSDASLQISIGNDAPFTISAIHVYPILPDGFSLSKGTLLPYIDGPISPWGSFSFSMEIDINDGVKPGYHKINFTIEYLLNSGGDGVKLNESLSLLIYVERIGGIRYLFYRWAGYSPGPGSVGASLILVFRNDLFETMDGLYAVVQLPEGFISTYTGTSMVNVTPYSTSSLAELSNILSGDFFSLTSNDILSSRESVSKGDYIILNIPLIISPEIDIGVYNAVVSLNFIDEWSMVREITVKCQFNLPGSVDYVEVIEERSRLVVGDRETNVSIVVKNPGSSPMYDTYIGINSMSQVVAFSSSVKHLTVIYPGEEVELTWRASVSPITSFIGGVPVLVSISYSDSIGVRHYINQTVILYVEGLARLKVIDVYIDPETPYPNSSISVSATIVNIGSDVAKNTEIYLSGEHLITNSDSYTYLGDVDEGTQIPFTLYGSLDDYEGETKIYLVIKYGNIYNEESTIKYPITITVKRQPPPEGTTSQPMGFIEDYWKVLVVGAVSIFLVLSVVLIYRMYIASKSKLGMG